MRITLAILLIVFFIGGCSKMEEKKLTDNKNQQGQNDSKMTNPHGNMQQNNQQEPGDMDMAPDDAVDPKADELSKDANDFENVYNKNKTESNKKILAEKHLAAGNYLEFKAKLSPKNKYGPALKHFNRVLELQPDNAEAKANKKQIEDIYEMMGKQIPK